MSISSEVEAEAFTSSPDSENPRPDAVHDCEEIRQRFNGWNEDSERLIKVVLLSGRCYKSKGDPAGRENPDLGPPLQPPIS